jgi:hypothetical protein
VTRLAISNPSNGSSKAEQSRISPCKVGVGRRVSFVDARTLLHRSCMLPRASCSSSGVRRPRPRERPVTKGENHVESCRDQAGRRQHFWTGTPTYRRGLLRDASAVAASRVACPRRRRVRSPLLVAPGVCVIASKRKIGVAAWLGTSFALVGLSAKPTRLLESRRGGAAESVKNPMRRRSAHR